MQQLKLLQTSIPVIAIGGILPDDIPDLKATGIHGFALSSALLQAEHKKVMVTNIYKTLC
jgi:thiamine-phosphate pyrophosphorylase